MDKGKIFDIFKFKKSDRNVQNNSNLDITYNCQNSEHVDIDLGDMDSGPKRPILKVIIIIKYLNLYYFSK